MPKIIEGAREKILVNAKVRLFKNGYQHLSLREVAKESGIATGTIYNYFTNKDHLIAGIMLEDWEVAMQKAEESIVAATNVPEGVFGIRDAVTEFCQIYDVLWKQPAVAAAASKDMPHCCGFLEEQIKNKVICLLEKLQLEEKKQYTDILVTLILLSCRKEKAKRQLEQLMQLIF